MHNVYLNINLGKPTLLLKPRLLPLFTLISMIAFLSLGFNQICGKTYGSLPSLHYHKSSLHLKRRFACHLCDATYHQRTALNGHIKKVHEGIFERKPCQICGRDFAGNSALKKHLESTHGSRKFPCATCGKEFSRQGGLHAHVASAHLGKRYECDLCGKSFTQSGTLAGHKRTHHGK